MKSRKVIYWIAWHNTDSECYAIRKKTKKALTLQIKAGDCEDCYTKPEKVCVKYSSALDLIDQVLGEGGESFAHMLAEN